MLRFHDNHLSGNGCKPRLLLALLGSACEAVEIDIMKGESRTPEFLARNPNGLIPVLEREVGSRIAESSAILHLLAEGSRFLPTDRPSRALVLQWMFFEQYSHEPFVVVAPNAHLVRSGSSLNHPCRKHLPGHGDKPGLLLEQDIGISGRRARRLEQFRVPAGWLTMGRVIVRSKA